MKKIVVIFSVLILLGAAFYWYSQSSKSTPSNGSEQNTQVQDGESELNDQTTQTSVPETVPAQTSTPDVPSQGSGVFSDGSEAEGMAPDILVSEVSYDGQKFSPKTLNIKVGDVVIFKNDSQKNFWPASGPHPEHTSLAGFDAKKSIPPGEEFQFKFTKTGEWGFHDHLNPSATGTISVK
jgi:plastocyanin